MRHRAIPLLVLLMSGIGPPEAVAQLGPGVTERVVSMSDPSMSYATFVPSSYRPDSPSPLLIVLDPRGRALLPLERLQPAAERLGYLIISSYDSRSDEEMGPTERAVAAMIEDAQDHFNIDVRRLYFVGFSGTARLAWSFGQRFGAYTAGVLGFGAGLPYQAMPATMAASGGFPFVYYGGAGDLDFNWEELRRLDRTLDGFGMRHFVDEWSGGHAWPDATALGRALEWFDTEAVTANLQARSGPELLDRLDAGLSRAGELEREGRVLVAERLLEDLIDAYAPHVDAARATAELTRLRTSREVERTSSAVDEILERRAEFDRDFVGWQRRVLTSRSARDVEGHARDLDLDALLVEASGAESREQRSAAQRMLESIHVFAIFYGPEALFGEGAYEVALGLLGVADRIHLDDPRVYFGQARAHARLGQRDAALEALRRVEATGLLTARRASEHPDLAPLRGDPAFQALLERLPN